MNDFDRRGRAGRAAAVAAAIGFSAIAAFQAALAAGAPWGHAAWGGAHARLSTAERIGSATAVVVWATAALIVLGRGGFWGGRRQARLLSWATWFFAGLSLAGALLNFGSPSRWENFILGPFAFVLGILCIVVARSSPNGRVRGRMSAVEPPPP
jgi:hypothetical protein